jgi:hypothetical protein
VGFFDDVAPPREERWEVDSHRQADWVGPPENVAGVTVPLDIVLANTGDAAVVITGARAYPTGLALAVALLRRPVGAITHEGFEKFRLGIGLADGRTVTGERWHEDPAATARLVQRGGGGGGLTWEQDYWLWPLPPAGTLQIACQWLPAGIEETVVEIDAAPIREAAARAVELWPDERPVG